MLSGPSFFLQIFWNCGKALIQSLFLVYPSSFFYANQLLSWKAFDYFFCQTAVAQYVCCLAFSCSFCLTSSFPSSLLLSLSFSLSFLLAGFLTFLLSSFLTFSLSYFLIFVTVFLSYSLTSFRSHFVTFLLSFSSIDLLAVLFSFSHSYCRTFFLT